STGKFVVNVVNGDNTTELLTVLCLNPFETTLSNLKYLIMRSLYLDRMESPMDPLACLHWSVDVLGDKCAPKLGRITDDAESSTVKPLDKFVSQLWPHLKREGGSEEEKKQTHDNINVDMEDLTMSCDSIDVAVELQHYIRFDHTISCKKTPDTSKTFGRQKLFVDHFWFAQCHPFVCDRSHLEKIAAIAHSPNDLFGQIKIPHPSEMVGVLDILGCLDLLLQELVSNGHGQELSQLSNDKSDSNTNSKFQFQFQFTQGYIANH
ncbi:hypothetical protein RFI_09005, partial [Reticulomyxa filosa]